MSPRAAGRAPNPVHAARRNAILDAGETLFSLAVTEDDARALINLEMPDGVADTLRRMLDWEADLRGTPRQWDWHAHEGLQHD